MRREARSLFRLRQVYSYHGAFARIIRPSVRQDSTKGIADATARKSVGQRS